jgi:predicted Zn-dependent peptidase
MKNERFFLIALLQSEMVAGSWEKAFDDLGKIEKITAKDIQKIVEEYFTENNRVIAKIEKKKEVKK